MTDKELKKLSRSDLLEILVGQSQEIDSLKEELNNLRAEIEKKEIKIRNAGSIAEASLEINGVFEAAQKAAQQYVDNVRRLDSEHGTFVEAQRKRIEATVGEASVRADEIIKAAEDKAGRIIAEAGNTARIEAEKIITEAREAARNVKPSDPAVSEADNSAADAGVKHTDTSDDTLTDSGSLKDSGEAAQDVSESEKSGRSANAGRPERKKKKRR